MATKFRIKVTGQYNEATFLVDPKRYNPDEKWTWLTDSQRKRLERIFGAPACYYCNYEIISKRYKLLYRLDYKFHDLILAVGETCDVGSDFGHVHVTFNRILRKPTPHRTGIARITTRLVESNDEGLRHIGITESVTIAKQ